MFLLLLNKSRDIIPVRSCSHYIKVFPRFEPAKGLLYIQSACVLHGTVLLSPFAAGENQSLCPIYPSSGTWRKDLSEYSFTIHRPESLYPEQPDTRQPGWEGGTQAWWCAHQGNRQYTACRIPVFRIRVQWTWIRTWSYFFTLLENNIKFS